LGRDPGKTLHLQSITDPVAGHVILISEITRVEIAAAIGSRRRAGTISEQERNDAFDLLVRHATTEYRLIAVEPPVTDRAMLLTQRHRLRAYDAVQLASALVVDESYREAELPPIVFVSADRDLLAAAQAEGLATDDPNTHP
jgi:predicted nucleic acid-binding protein